MGWKEQAGKGFRMLVILRTVLLGHCWTCFSRDKNEAAQELDSVIGDCGSRVAHGVFLTLFPVRWRNSRHGKVHPRAACRPVKLLLRALLGIAVNKA